MYAAPSSNKQMRNIVGKNRFYLGMILHYFTGHGFYPLNKNDDEVYSSLKFKNSDQATNDYSVSILFHFTKLAKIEIKEYLDFGCGQCNSSEQMAQLLGVPANGSDVREIFDASWKRNAAVNFAEITEKHILGFPETRKWDLITCVMVLHHIEAPEKQIAAMSRTVNPGGLVILKEHDCFNAQEKMLVDIEHSLFIVRNDPKDWKKKVKEQKIYCRPWTEWTKMFEACGFENVHFGGWGTDHRSFGSTRKCILVFRKK